MTITQDLNEGQYVIQNGQIYTISPLTSTTSLVKEIEEKTRQELLNTLGQHDLYKELGRAIEYLTQNNYKVKIIKNNQYTELNIWMPFEGNTIEHQRTINERTEKPDGTTEIKKARHNIKLYIPKGWLGLKLILKGLTVETIYYKMTPNIQNKSPDTYTQEEQNFYYKLHPHKLPTADDLCHGMYMNFPNKKFNISYAVELLNACLNGDPKTKGTSLFNYNKNSPATHIESCLYGFQALELHKTGKSDEEIIKTILAQQIADKKKTIERQTECSGCNESIIDDDEEDYLEGTRFCENCNNHVCSDCYHGNNLCSDCYNDHYTTCHRCECEAHTDSTSYCEHCEHDYCESCADTHMDRCTECETFGCVDCLKFLGHEGKLECEECRTKRQQEESQ